MEIHMDLTADLGEFARSVMSDAGWNVVHVENNDHRALVAYAKLKRYLISHRPRTVLKSGQFDPLGHEAGIERLENAVHNGDDLNIYMTDRFDDITASDGLLDHWGIRHFHLGTETDPATGRISRTRHVLFGLINDSHVYFIKVGTHGRDSRYVWYQQEMIETIHRNWPEAIERFRINSITGSSPKYDDPADVKSLRDANAVALLQVEDGTVYFELGMGTTGDGTQIQDLQFADGMSRAVQQVEKHILDKYPLIRDNARRLGYYFKDPVTFRLKKARLHADWDIVETCTDYLFRV